jgi:hypothetical protein
MEVGREGSWSGDWRVAGGKSIYLNVKNRIWKVTLVGTSSTRVSTFVLKATILKFKVEYLRASAFSASIYIWLFYNECFPVIGSLASAPKPDFYNLCISFYGISTTFNKFNTDKLGKCPSPPYFI